MKQSKSDCEAAGKFPAVFLWAKIKRTEDMTGFMALWSLGEWKLQIGICYSKSTINREAKNGICLDERK